MSETIEVLPTNDTIPTFGEVVSLATTYLHAYLADIGISARPAIHFEVHTPPDARIRVRPHPTDPFRWGSEKYAWFFIDGVGGGTDAYYSVNEDIDREVWEEEFAKPRPTVTTHEHAVRTYLEVGHHWWFRRSAGQPAAINITYGMLAAALAELTDGLLHSDDGAWEYQRFPCRPDDFLRFYYRPENALSEEKRDWAKQNQSRLREAFGA